MSDPLPQAMVLTAIVITLGMTAFLLAMAYRSWQLNGHDEVQDDVGGPPDHATSPTRDEVSAATSTATARTPTSRSTRTAGRRTADGRRRSVTAGDAVTGRDDLISCRCRW